jgi:predicted Zn-dependent protease
MTLRSFKPFVILLLTFVVPLTGCLSHKYEVFLPSPEADRQMGLEVSEQVAEHIGIFNDPDITSYVSKIGQRVAKEIPNKRFNYTFHILDQPEANAFAAPGGYVYVSRGLLALANSEDELGNVLGHEIIHVSHRHTAKQLAKQRVPNLLSLPGRVVGRVVSRDLGRLLNSPINIFGISVMMVHSRQHELEADRLGQELSANAGYDPKALATILDGLEQEEQIRTGVKRRPSFFDTHPSTPRRVAGITERAGTIEWMRQPGIADAHTAFLRHFEGLLVGTNPANGVFQKQKFLHPNLDFSIEFPLDWEAMNSPQAVGAVSPNQDGLIVLGIHGKGTDPEQAALDFTRALTKEFGVEPSRSQALQLGQWPAYLVTFTDATGREPMHMHFLWVASRGLIYRMIGLAPEYHRETVKKTALSFRPLTVEEKSSILETRVRIASAQAGEDIIGLSDRTGNVWDAQTTAVMNGIRTEAPLKQGQLIKIAVSQEYMGSAKVEMKP